LVSEVSPPHPPAGHHPPPPTRQATLLTRGTIPWKKAAGPSLTHMDLIVASSLRAAQAE
jgi:hypothetical protein